LLFLPLTAEAESAQDASSPPDSPLIIMETSMGTIKIELFEKEAPLSVENFRNYVKQGFYNGLIFHRVIPKFMIQGGGFEPGMNRRPPTLPPVPPVSTTAAPFPPSLVMPYSARWWKAWMSRTKSLPLPPPP
jgi:hypothetical protein